MLPTCDIPDSVYTAGCLETDDNLEIEAPYRVEREMTSDGQMTSLVSNGNYEESTPDFVVRRRVSPRVWLAVAALGVVVVLASASTALEGCQGSATQTTTTTVTHTSTLTTTTTVTSITSTTTKCCPGNLASCLACEAGQSQGEYCANRTHFDVEGCSSCGVVEDGYDYPGGTLRKVWGHWDHHGCCKECREEALCTSWTWQDSERICLLKNQVSYEREKRHGYKSGLPGGDSMVVQLRNAEGMCLINMAETLHVGVCHDHRLASEWAYNLKTGALTSKESTCLVKSTTADKAEVASCDTANSQASWAFDASAGGLRLSKNGVRAKQDAEWKAVGDLCLFTKSLDLEPCAAHSDDQVWKMWPSNNAPTNTLFCFSVMLPWTHEPAMLKFQHASHNGIFGCEASAVYSNDTFQLGTELSTTRVHALVWNGKNKNGQVAWQHLAFVEIWRQVVREGWYLKHDWTVKVDPEAVFLADRLRHQVKHLHYGYDIDAMGSSKYENGVFLNNCPFGIRRSLIVISKRAMLVFDAGSLKCEDHPFETAYLKKCMLGLNVAQLDEFNILADGQCHQGKFSNFPQWQDCKGDHVAFHPFATPDSYSACVKAASAFSN